MKKTGQIDLMKLALYVLKRIWLVILCAAIGFAGMYWQASRRAVDTYTASGTMYMVNGNPNLVNYHQGDFFDLENGCFVSTQPIHGQFVHGQQAKHILTLMRMNYATMHLFKMNRVERNEILDMLLKYYSIHIPGSADLKSLPILKELFD
jgi:hypothetical protein